MGTRKTNLLYNTQFAHIWRVDLTDIDLCLCSSLLTICIIWRVFPGRCNPLPFLFSFLPVAIPSCEKSQQPMNIQKPPAILSSFSFASNSALLPLSLSLSLSPSDMKSERWTRDFLWLRNLIDSDSICWWLQEFHLRIDYSDLTSL